MHKFKNSYACNGCSYVTAKWLGCCPECKQWETFEAVKPQTRNKHQLNAQLSLEMTTLDALTTKPQMRMVSGINEWDRVTGGGIIPGSLLILTGDPGIGKSTLLLQISNALARQYTVFYFSTEESLQQVKLRAQRLGALHEKLLFSDRGTIETIIATAEQARPDIIVIDSIQNCHVTDSQAIPGSINQLREATFSLMKFAKEHDIATLMSGHITKDGMIAGPKTLEHMVDAVFYLQGEDRWQTRILRSVKNRFGTINELGFFEMKEQGLQEMPNINEHLINDSSNSPGSALISFLEGSRPLLLELQALTINSKLAVPQRVISGIDHKQVILIAAILEKYLHVKLSAQDIFFKVSGGFKVTGSSADLGIALALLSSYFQQPLPHKSIALGEISLTGSIKPINQIEPLIKEAAKFGINTCLLAHAQKIETPASIKKFSMVHELFALFPLDSKK